MSFVVDVPTLSVVIASLSVLGGAVYYMLETRYQRRIRQTENVKNSTISMAQHGRKRHSRGNKQRLLDGFHRLQRLIAKYAGTPEEKSLIS